MPEISEKTRKKSISALALFAVCALLAAFFSSCGFFNIEDDDEKKKTSEEELTTPEDNTEAETETGEETTSGENVTTENVTTEEVTTEDVTTEGETEPPKPPEPAHIVDTSKAEYTYDELGEDLALLAEKYPEIFSYKSIGKSADRKEIYCGVIGSKNAAKQLVVSAGIHAREYLMPLVAMSICEYYLENFDNPEVKYNGKTIREILADTDIYLIPMCNPDGIMLSEVGLSSLNDKSLEKLITDTYLLDKSLGWTACETVDEYLHYNWKANARGVDINRNFPTEDFDELGGMKRPCFRDYKGESAASEPETQALCEFTGSLTNLKAVICLHTQGELIYWLLDRMEGIPAFRTERLARVASEATGYPLDYSEFFDSSYSDWCILELGVPAITVESGKGEYPLPISEYPGAFDSNLFLWLAAANEY